MPWAHLCTCGGRIDTVDRISSLPRVPCRHYADTTRRHPCINDWSGAQWGKLAFHPSRSHARGQVGAIWEVTVINTQRLRQEFVLGCSFPSPPLLSHPLYSLSLLCLPLSSPPLPYPSLQCVHMASVSEPRKLLWSTHARRRVLMHFEHKIQ
jgi:hypothetical protein